MHLVPELKPNLYCTDDPLCTRTIRNHICPVLTMAVSARPDPKKPAKAVTKGVFAASGALFLSSHKNLRLYTVSVCGEYDVPCPSHIVAKKKDID